MAVDEAPIRVADVQFRPIRFGPWKGSIRSMPADRVPPEFMAESDSDAASQNYSFNPHYGTWFRRLGQTIQFDTLPTASGVGLLPAKWSARCRQLSEYSSDSISDSVPTVCALLTKETLADTTLVDDGRFSNFWIRDQVQDTNYTVGSEFSATTYPAPGSTQTYRYVPLWHDSGDGGMVRGTTEFERRFFFNGSRGFNKTGNQIYHPSYRGTPSRIQIGTSESSIATVLPLLGGAQGGSFGIVDGIGGSNAALALQTNDGDTSHIEGGAGALQFYVQMNPVSSPPSSCTIYAWAKGVAPDTAIDLWFYDTVPPFGGGPGAGFTKVPFIPSALAGGSYTLVSYTLSPAEIATITGGANGWTNVHVGFRSFGITWITQIYLEVPASNTTGTTRLIPSGPFPACHAGTLTKGNPVAGSSGTVFMHPSSDVAAGAWLNQAASGTNLYLSIDETFVDNATTDADYIQDAGAAGAKCEFNMSSPGFDFTSSDHTAKISVRAGVFGISTGTLTVRVQEGGSTKASKTWSGSELGSPSSAFRWLDYTLSGPEVDAVSDWTTGITIEVEASGTTAFGTGIRVSYAAIEVTATGAALVGGWRGSDRFFYGVIPIFEDDSFWMPTIPRFPNTTLTNGFNLFTVDSSNPTTSYDKVIWDKIPVLWFGNKQKAIVRSDKIDSTLTDNLALQPLKLRIVAIVDNAVTTYDDYAADDDSLQLDPAGLLVRYDHIMPPRSRYIFGGDMRICHAYGTVNPCAITIAPVGRTADYDLNLIDTASALYTTDASYMRVTIDTAGTSLLELSQADGSATVSSTTSFNLTTTYTTLEKLVDAINLTSCADNGQQWRAQLCPGVDPNAVPLTHLAAHKRVLASITTTISTTTITGTGLGKVAIGSRVSGAGITAGTYVTKINSSTSLTLSAVATASASVTLTFYQEFGDSPTTATANQGWQRVIAQSLPGFLYFNRTYLDQFATEKASIWMTTASPGSTKSAPNCFSGKVSNKFFPPNAKAGKAMGGIGIRQGFRVLFENQRGIIDNLANTGSGLDEEYRLKITHDSSGCCSWASIAAGTNFGVYAAPEGIIAGDLEREILLSDAIWNPPSSDASTGTGDFSYEIPQSIAATAADNDNAMLYCSIVRDVLRVNYRTSSSTTHPDRQVVYDFSSGAEAAGIEALFKQGKEPWGWSTPFTRSVTCVGEGRRTDGAHVYGWNDANAQSTGDGRVDEIDTSQTDNSTAISARMTTPWIRPGSRKLSFHRFVAEHATPSGATAAFDFHRSIADETYSLTPSTSSALYIRDWKELTLPARSPTAAGYFGFRQSAGTAQEIRSLEVYVEELDTYS